MAENRIEELFSDSEDDLPSGWEMRATDAGRVFYVDHGTKVTQWAHPNTGREKFLSPELPFGWEKAFDNDGTPLFIDLINKRTTCVDPRIAFSISDKKKAKIKFDADSTAVAVLRGRDLRGKTALITGANSGIGYETALALSLHGCHVVLACRNLKRGEAAADKIRKGQTISSAVDVVECDLCSLESVESCATHIIDQKWFLDIVILNAGVLGLPYSESIDGIEKTFATNHLGHFYLVDLLKEVLIKSSPSRVVVVSSESHRFPSLYNTPFQIADLPMKEENYCPIVAYNQSKLCNLMFTIELNRRMSPYGVRCNAVHPGNFVYTNLQRHSALYQVMYLICRPFSKSATQGAATTVYCATSVEMESVGGYYFNNCCGCHPSEEANNEKLAKQLWDLSEKLAYRKIDACGRVLGIR